ncbi:hypothetical protein QUF50_07650 [Thiotrichales bacterium HSG1]|nr:hypothetical protein [Thiotrichales bacterium HSG1]
MRAFGFAFIGVFLLLLAVSYQELNQMFPEIFGIVYDTLNSIGTEILYIAGILAIFIAFFSWLPPWLGFIVYIMLVFGGGYFLMDNDIHLRVDSFEIF